MTIGLGASVSASELCEQLDQVTFDAIVQVPKDEYMVYGRLNRQGQTTGARLAVNNIDATNCRTVGSAQLTDSAWTKIGSLSIADAESLTLSLVADDQSIAQDASAPSVMFVSTSSPPCADVNNCGVTYSGQSYTLSPQKISLNSDTLRAAHLQPIGEGVTMKKAIYYANDSIVYTSDIIGEPFDTRYIGPGEYELKTTLVSSNGQALSRTEKLEHESTIINLLSPLYFKNRSTINLSLGIMLAFIIYLIVFSQIRRLANYLHWKKTHVVNPTQPVAPQLSSTEAYFKNMQEEGRKKDAKVLVGALLVPVALVGFVLFVSTFVIGRFTVDGVSMETTLHDKSQEWYYKLPVTIANFNNTTPKLDRGDVVVLKHDDNNLFVPIEEQKQSYVVKRILGLPGERVVVKDGSITVFNSSSPDGLVPDKGSSWESVVVPSTGRFIDLVLKEGELFVVGDDRDYSIDSRNYGPVSTSDVAGIVYYKHKSGLKPYVETE
jgi:signal peptidase I